MRNQVLCVGFDDLTMEEAVARALAFTDGRTAGRVVTPNPEIVWLCRGDQTLCDAVNGADLVLADGIGILYGARILGRPLKAKLPGIDFAAALLEELAKSGKSVYLLGAAPGVAEAAGVRIAAQYPGLVIAGARDGYFQDSEPVVRDINAASPDFLMVCLGAPKQECWMAEHRARLSVGLMAGLGGSLDVFAGAVNRAPPAFRRMNLEWLYRLLKEPRRIGRMMKLPLFLQAVCAERVRHGRSRAG